MGESVHVREDARIYRVGGGWGDKIEWFDREEFEGPPQTHFTVVGWKASIPRVGDFLEGKFRLGIARFVFTRITRVGNPPDMFYGTVAFTGYKDGE